MKLLFIRKSCSNYLDGGDIFDSKLISSLTSHKRIDFLKCVVNKYRKCYMLFYGFLWQ